MRGEISSAAEDFLLKLIKITEESGHISDQVFNWSLLEKLTNKTYIAKSEKSASGLKAAKDYVTFFLGSNTSGDCLLKPLLIDQFFSVQ